MIQSGSKKKKINYIYKRKAYDIKNKYLQNIFITHYLSEYFSDVSVNSWNWGLQLIKNVSVKIGILHKTNKNNVFHKRVILWPTQSWERMLTWQMSRRQCHVFCPPR